MIKNLVIIGAGPIGLYAGYRAGLAKLDTTLLECDKIGGHLNRYSDNIYSAACKLRDIPGHYEINPQELIRQLTLQLESTLSKSIRYEADPKLEIRKVIGGFEIHTQNNFFERDIHTRSIVLATGQGCMNPVKYKINLDGEVLNEFVTVNYDKNKIPNLTSVLVIGKDRIAIEYVINLLKADCKVFFLSLDKIDLSKDDIDFFKNYSGRITVYENSFISEVRKPMAIIQNIQTGAKSAINFSECSIFLGHNLENTIEFINLYIEHSNSDYTYAVDKNCQTSIPMIYAIGDCVLLPYTGDLTIGFGQAAIAINHCSNQLQKEK